MGLVVASLNTESGCRPGFHRYLKSYIKSFKPDVIALQEVHLAQSANVPETFMPGKPGKRIHPQRLRLFQELSRQYRQEYKLLFTPHFYGLHDCEQGEHRVAFGQVTMVRRETWSVDYVRLGLVFGTEHRFNTEHEQEVDGLPCSKAAITVLITNQKKQSVVVSNVHGFWLSRGKIDIPERFDQNLGIAAQIARVLEWQDTPLVLCVGDLNYRSNMKALDHLRNQSCFGGSGRILNHDFRVTRTRTDFYTNWEKEPEADFMIASSELANTTQSMKAHLDAASDHALVDATFKI
jgi:endonuclease/exonuclease/phosphatase family metal-dependent hydrolase